MAIVHPRFSRFRRVYEPSEASYSFHFVGINNKTITTLQQNFSDWFKNRKRKEILQCKDSQEILDFWLSDVMPNYVTVNNISALHTVKMNQLYVYNFPNQLNKAFVLSQSLKDYSNNEEPAEVKEAIKEALAGSEPLLIAYEKPNSFTIRQIVVDKLRESSFRAVTGGNYRNYSFDRVKALRVGYFSHQIKQMSMFLSLKVKRDALETRLKIELLPELFTRHDHLSQEFALELDSLDLS